MFEKATDTSAPVNPLFKQRWSGVAFDPDRKVQQRDIISIMEAARWAPSCFGDEPWRYLVLNRHQDAEAWEKAFNCLAPGNQDWNRNVPVLIIACHDTRYRNNDKTNTWASYDTGAASISLCLQAAHLGLMTHQMAGFSPEQVRESFQIPERYQAKAVIALGYQAAPEKIPEQFRDREMADRKRRPLQDNFFSNRWGEGIASDQ